MKIFPVSLKQAKVFEEHSDEFFAWASAKAVFSDSYTALIFCFFCIKTKEKIIKNNNLLPPGCT